MSKHYRYITFYDDRSTERYNEYIPFIVDRKTATRAYLTSSITSSKDAAVRNGKNITTLMNQQAMGARL